jgi:hypothetical protein
MDYITPDDLLVKFGEAWASEEDRELFAEQINAWLYGRQIPLVTTEGTKQVIRSAAFFLARAAKENQLYVDTENVKAMKVSAQPGTSVEYQYAAYKNAQNRWVKLAEDLLVDFSSPTYSTPLYKIN